MNIQLSQESVNRKRKQTSKSASSLSYGLNNRTIKAKKKSKSSSILEDDDSDSGGEQQGTTSTNNTTAKHSRNSDLVLEQEALRKRTILQSSQITSSKSTTVYDYDAEYEQFSSNRQIQKQEKERKQQLQQDQQDGTTKKKSSRYIATILKHAQDREREREIVFERKVAKEQKMEEETNEEYHGKEKFMTSAYRKRLEERKLWQQREELREVEELENDVTKKGSDAMASFYGNFSKNVAVGGRSQEQDLGSKKDKISENDLSRNQKENNARESNSNDYRDYTNRGISNYSSAMKKGMNNNDTIEPTKVDPEEEKRRIAIEIAKARSLRSEKLAAARERYFRRRGILQDQ